MRNTCADVDDPNCASTIGRKWLNVLPDKNSLKPAVWAKHNTKPQHFGVSLGVPAFVRPLYLFIKLNQLSRVTSENKLKDVSAFQMKRNKTEKDKDKEEKDKNKEPCVSCQIFFKFISFYALGNCAEYDVIGNVNPCLLQTPQWEKFRLACQRHFDAFKAMLAKLERECSSKVIEKYHTDLCNPPLKVLNLRYQLADDGVIIQYVW